MQNFIANKKPTSNIQNCVANNSVNKTLKLVLKFIDCTEISQSDRARFLERLTHAILNHYRDSKQNTK